MCIFLKVLVIFLENECVFILCYCLASRSVKLCLKRRSNLESNKSLRLTSFISLYIFPVSIFFNIIILCRSIFLLSVSSLLGHVFKTWVIIILSANIILNNIICQHTISKLIPFISLRSFCQRKVCYGVERQAAAAKYCESCCLR